MTLLVIFLVAIIAYLLWHPGFGFRAQKPDHYAEEGPVFDLRTHLAGPLVSEGVIYGPLGRVTSRFVAEMDGTFEGGSGVLREHFRMAGKGTLEREWALTIGNDGSVRATAADIVGEARGQQAGSAMMLSYRLRLKVPRGEQVLDVTDWMYLMENGTIINRSEMRKFGLKVAELIATIRPAPANV